MQNTALFEKAMDVEQKSLMEIIRCANCGAEVAGKFCPECGQERVERITFSALKQKLVDAFCDFESPFLKTFISLSYNPGRVYREYVTGARKRYFAPIRYSLWIMTLVIALASIMDVALIDVGTRNDDDAISSSSALLEVQAALNSTLIPFTLFGALLVSCLARLAYFRSGFNLAEYFICCALSLSQFFVVIALFVILGLYPDEAYALKVLYGLSTAYLAWGLAELHQPRSLLGYARAAIVAAVSLILLLGALDLVNGVVIGFMLSG